MDARSASFLRGCFDTSRRTVVFILDRRDITAVDDEGRAHCIAGRILGALKEGNRFNCRISQSLDHGCVQAALHVVP